MRPLPQRRPNGEPRPNEREFQIGEVLNRRADLSTFVVHLTRDNEMATAGQNLESIIRDQQLRAGRAMGWGQGVPEIAGQTQKVVCFSETPLEQLCWLFANIASRQVRLSPYGLAFTKVVSRRRGANPVWYVDQSPGHVWAVPRALDALRDDAVQRPTAPHSADVAKVLPFLDVMGTWSESSRKEFWWEREWRHVGDFDFNLAEVALWFCPESEFDFFEGTLGDRLGSGAPRCVDPSWSLERIVARLRGLRPEDVTPFA